jgi:hypothetical protein
MHGNRHCIPLFIL